MTIALWIRYIHNRPTDLLTNQQTETDQSTNQPTDHQPINQKPSDQLTYRSTNQPHKQPISQPIN
jgi:hypothetical protein